MNKKILSICFLLLVASCHKDNPVSPSGINNQTDDNKWVTITNMPVARGYLCGAEANNKIYLFGGLTDLTNVSDVVEAFDPETNKWTEKNRMPEKILGQAAAEINGKIYVFGGRTESLYSGRTLNYTYQYDPDADTWTRKKDMPTARGFFTASAIDGKIYTIGGCTEGYEAGASVQMYDPASDSWTTKSSLPMASALNTACIYDGKIYVLGGGSSHDASAGTSFPYFYVYDPAGDSWDIKADIEPSRWGSSSGIINNKLYLCGGIFSKIEGGVVKGTLLNDLREYDLSSEIWTTRASMPSHRRCFLTFVYNNKLLAFGGVTGEQGAQQIVKSVIEYIPPAE